MQLNTKNIAWVAGFLEGEGCFTPGSNHCERIVVNQVQREPLDRLKGLFGGSLQRYNRSRHNPKHNDIHSWTLTGNIAIQVMMTIYSLMSPKRQEQIKSVILRWRKRRTKVSGWTSCKYYHPYTEGSFYIQKSTGQRFCKVCNHRRGAAYRAKLREERGLHATKH